MAPNIIGIDDWAWRRNQRYGTIICDLEHRKTIALLPDREPMTAQTWLSGQPQIAIVARDRGGGYAMACKYARNLDPLCSIAHHADINVETWSLRRSHFAPNMTPPRN